MSINTMPFVLGGLVTAGIVLMGHRVIDRTSEENVAAQTFDAPMFEGMRLDACVVRAHHCGEDAATAWCRTQGYAFAKVFPLDRVGRRGIPTKLIGTREVCQRSACTAFSRITCIG